MDIREIITQVHRAHFESVALLAAYVNDMAAAIGGIRTKREALLKKLVSFKTGEQQADPDPPHEPLVSLALSPEETDTVIEAVDLVRGYAEKYPELTATMAFVYLVALFDAYLLDVFHQVILHRPEVLKSSKQLSYEKVLECSSREELVEYLARRELNELSYKPIVKQAEYYRDRFGVAFDDSGTPTELLVQIHATRNLLVHNKGVVNHVYLEQLPASRAKLGARVKVSFEYFSMAAVALGRISDHVAETLIKKHGEGNANETSA